MRSEMEPALTHLGVLTKTNTDAMLENRLIKWTYTLQWKIINAVKSTFDDALQANYLNLNNGLESGVFSAVEQALHEVVRSGHTPKISKAQMRSLVQTRAAVDTTVKRVLCNTGLILPIAERAKT